MACRMTELDAAIRRGLADAEAVRTVPATVVFDRLEDKYRVMSQAKTRWVPDQARDDE